MSNQDREPNQDINETVHAMLVVWGQYAHCLGIPQGYADVPSSQKTVEYSPQSKVLEFLVAHLGGLEYLKDISLSATPLDQDRAVAQAWGQSGVGGPQWCESDVECFDGR
jgi:hypothetical protein